MSESNVELQPSEKVMAQRDSVPVHLQFHGQLVAYKMRSDVWLTSERLVGSRRFGRSRQITPNIDRSRITEVSVVERLRMKGVSRRPFRGCYLRLELQDPGTTVAFHFNEDVATEWAAELQPAVGSNT